ncbi:hypothetical protein PsorP6_006884 [Peronosclerospora sorghi]|uniref:Uncharacterized protein n=1 Tax=Peronosclerospora sorghi TaxID=230839 RepID=A0ACC0W6S4_9STRA|nr:hypothetical protein PsorP6_006884 [Peronosclerospora sorghi]
MADSDASSGSSSSSSSDSVLIRVPLDQKRRKKLRELLQEDQRRQREGQWPFSADCNKRMRFKPPKLEADVDRNKSEHICVVCEQEGDDLLVCVGPCISAFHARCLPCDYSALGAQDDAWLCPNCHNKSHACFHCKEMGVEMLGDEIRTSTSVDPTKRPVGKCRALSCGKFYHQECITQFPLARIAINTHFICPLHTCAGCNQSGAQQEAVRCMRCPVAYHARCLPSKCVRQISSKLIICPKHAGESKMAAKGGESDVKRGEMESMTHVGVSGSNEWQAQGAENDDERMSEASALSGSSGRKKEKREKREKREKKKKKKKRKKERHKEKRELSEKDVVEEESGEKKSKRSKRESLEGRERRREDKSSPLTATDARSPTSSLLIFESPETATKRIQERLEEVLGKSDEDDSDVSTSGRSVQNILAGSHKPNNEPREIRSARCLDASEVDENQVKKVTESATPSSLVAINASAGENESLSSLQEAERTKDDVWKLESPKSQSSNLPPSSVFSNAASTGLVFTHAPSEDEDEEQEVEGSGSATPRTARASGKKKKKKNKTKRDVQRVAKRDTSEEEDEAEEAKWVQCDSCKKWRTVPRDFNLDAMPNHWYCDMNTWDTRYASCDVAEEEVRANPTPKRRSKMKKSKSTASSTGDDGGYSSSGSGFAKRSGETTSAELMVLEEKEKKWRAKHKASKKRKVPKQIKEKYREVKWVQCESAQCGKWRIVPASINFDRLPPVWYCHLNTWAPELAKCSVPNPTEVDVFLLKQANRETRPPKKARASSLTQDAASSTSLLASSGDGMTTSVSLIHDASSTKVTATKHGKGGKMSASGALKMSSIDGDGAMTGGSLSCESGQYKTRGGRGQSGSNHTGLSSRIKKTVLEWAQCEKCNKWRKLPHHIKSSTLPDKWYCSLNHWDPTHAKCSVPEEVDQEPLPLPPHPGSHWHKGGHKGQRPKRGKLSYSELLYGSTGQLRKAYTDESSTQSFEYDGRTYHRDDQYKHSSMYVSPAAIAAAATMAGWSGSDRVNRETTYVGHEGVAMKPSQATVDHVAALVLEKMDLRRRCSVSELLDVVNAAYNESTTAPTGLASLAVVTAALGQLEHRGLVEKVHEDKTTPTQARVDSVFRGALLVPMHYRKVPTRPLKASKCWKLGHNLVVVSPVKDS